MSALEKIKAMTAAIITPAQAAEVLECNPQYIRYMAHHDPAALGFPVFTVGQRTKVLRLPFIAFVEGGGWSAAEQ